MFGPLSRLQCRQERARFPPEVAASAVLSGNNVAQMLRCLLATFFDNIFPCFLGFFVGLDCPASSALFRKAPGFYRFERKSQPWYSRSNAEASADALEHFAKG
jgi:hypothetical protein